MDYNPFNERQAGKIPAAISSRHDVSVQPTCASACARYGQRWLVANGAEILTRTSGRPILGDTMNEIIRNIGTGLLLVFMSLIVILVFVAAPAYLADNYSMYWLYLWIFPCGWLIYAIGHDSRHGKRY